MASSVTAEVAEYECQLDQISGALEADPENDELLTLKNELEDLIRITKEKLPISSSIVTTPDITTENDRKRKHDALESRKVGEHVLAKWVTGDHQFYRAKITSITGNQADPVYTVKFLDYNEVQTLQGYQLRSINELKKRPPEPAVKPIGKASTNTGINPPIPPPPPRDSSNSPSVRKKPATLKEDLTKQANSWSSFAKSGPKTKHKVGKKKAIGESSMFRTEEGGRVGVIGSGRSMTSDIGKRERHIFETRER